MDEIKDALKELRDEQKVIRESQIRMEIDVQHHVRRSDRLEAIQELHEARVSKNLEAISEQVKSIETPYKVVLWFIGAIGFVAVVLEIYNQLKGH